MNATANELHVIFLSHTRAARVRYFAYIGNKSIILYYFSGVLNRQYNLTYKKATENLDELKSKSGTYRGNR